ncbi:enoyl-coa delta isomerase 3-like [Plakobranchus ocellatus]|uniref:Enoyl-coa delta isomerase 3-like n=1 Tax=Plakobranchus ocellatus TaxID=259542 RepID=A0AAV3Z174_9GAST|nr:enoyl-coa delta isomerase 3-like [Plakobranchus ocellatus]
MHETYITYLAFYETLTYLAFYETLNGTSEIQALVSQAVSASSPIPLTEPSVPTSVKTIQILLRSRFVPPQLLQPITRRGVREVCKWAGSTSRLRSRRPCVVMVDPVNPGVPSSRGQDTQNVL